MGNDDKAMSLTSDKLPRTNQAESESIVRTRVELSAKGVDVGRDGGALGSDRLRLRLQRAHTIVHFVLRHEDAVDTRGEVRSHAVVQGLHARGVEAQRVGGVGGRCVSGGGC